MINSINSIHINSLFLFTMEKKKNGTYESPRTTRTQVSLESGICASSKDKVVQDDEKPTSISTNRRMGVRSSWIHGIK